MAANFPDCQNIDPQINASESGLRKRNLYQDTLQEN